MKHHVRRSIPPRRLWILLMLLGSTSTLLYAEVRPQAGFESYFGPSRMQLLTPWAGLRISLRPNVSLLLKYYHHNIRFRYINNEDAVTERKAALSNFTGALYAQPGKHEAYAALSYFTGTDAYRALALDAGLGIRVWDPIVLEVGTYLVDESSVLWYPEDEERRIFLYSAKIGLRLRLKSWLYLNPRLQVYRNSDDVDASTYAFGILISPLYPLYLNILYMRYTESAQYRFSGDYLSVGVNLYY